MRALALDLANRTGWALRAGSQTILVGAQDFTPRRGEGAGMRFVRFRRWLEKLYAAYPFGVVFYEQVIGISPRPGQSHQLQQYGGFLAIFQAWAEENGVPYSGVPVASIKKHATGNGNANKEAMLAAAAKLVDSLGIVAEGPLDHNGADALHLLLLTESDSFDP